MACVRCEILRVKLRALYLFHVEGKSFDEVAAIIISDPAYSGAYWMKGDRIMRSPGIEYLMTDVAVEVVKLNGN
ncbi:hypothetical protein Pfeifenkraut_BL30042 [Xanthomonas phage Pfeifenkraut]|uniref:Uncharacterized protein n=1 Tax=Xanthomonas phage Pfeifenkraut TaxID=2939132 RepID=A0A9E7E1R7_9CAUD|nr:hypothetical protein QAY91_gp42 [Xanthomonas phage Pfeifenkraut]URA06939.1 hypothetical protein Pfeifenkraut_BL30042 [Xanthomonas phage Pfeifenkraut]